MNPSQPPQDNAPPPGGPIVASWEKLSQQQFRLMREQLVALKQEFEAMKLAARQALEQSLSSGGNPEDLQVIDAVNQQVMAKLQHDYRQVEKGVQEFSSANFQEASVDASDSQPEPEPEAASLTQPDDQLLQQGLRLIDTQMEQVQIVMDQNLQTADELIQQGRKTFEEAGAYFNPIVSKTNANTSDGPSE